MRLDLIRHGEVNFSNYQGFATNEPRLSSRGEMQIEVTSDRLLGRPDFILTSPSARAYRSAEILAGHRMQDPVVHEWLAEVRFPDRWEGAHYASTVLPELNNWRRSSLFDYERGIPGGESIIDHRNRVETGLVETLAEYTTSPNGYDWDYDGMGPYIVMVSHEMTISTILCHLLGVIPNRVNFSLPFARIAELVLAPCGTSHSWRLTSFGR